MTCLESTVQTHSPYFVARWLGLVIGLFALSLWALPARAEEDPPARAGRLAELEGSVWLYDTEAREWIEAKRNRPITTGDRISTERDARAELRVGSTVVRLDSNTELEVTLLDDEHFALQLHSGSVATRLRTREAAREFELVTDEGRFEAARTGSYRFDREDDTTEATVASGQLQFNAPDSEVTVNAGQRAEFWNDGGVHHSFGAPQRDAFTDWVAASEGREERSVSSRYVSPEMTGVEDLDRYGRWEQDSEYGALWTPVNVVAGWAPYRQGHWAWISPWGWTWVDDAPWGFAPFHYGRWVYVRNNWCWSPGRYVARPVYAPALVAWVGGPQVNVSVTIGRQPTVGWFPLAPREVYVPSYRFTPRYLRHVNNGHVREISNINAIVNNPGRSVEHFSYRNRGLPNAITVVPSTVLERRQPVAPAVVGMRSPLHREALRRPPRIDAPVAPGGRRFDARRPGSLPVVVPPAPGRVVHDGRDNRAWDGRRGDRDRRGGDDARDGRSTERDVHGGQQPFSRDRRGVVTVPAQPAVQVNPAPIAPPPSLGRQAPPAPAAGGREDTRFGRPATPVNEHDRSPFSDRLRAPRMGGTDRPVPPVAPPAQVVPPSGQPAPLRQPPGLGRDGGDGRPGLMQRDAGDRFRHQRPQGQDGPPRVDPPRPPAAVISPQRPPSPPPVAHQPPPRPSVVHQPPPQAQPQAPRPQLERPGAHGGGRPNEPGRGDGGPRHRQVN